MAGMKITPQMNSEKEGGGGRGIYLGESIWGI